MLTCSVKTGVEMPEGLLEGVIDSGEPVDVRVGVLEGVPDGLVVVDRYLGTGR